ncbi:MAG: hypothetical protein JWN65_2703 [Solirubrobacterales bacterium]|nr:hypothetical protein [Solirubrobacterales bacterium]
MTVPVASTFWKQNAPSGLAQPDHPEKRNPGPGVAVSWTPECRRNCAEQMLPQLMPPGELVMTPAPPAAATVSVSSFLKTASTSTPWVITTVQVAAVPEHAPPQPSKRYPGSAAAVSVMLVPVLKGWAQETVQLMPTGELVTWPPVGPPPRSWGIWTVRLLVAPPPPPGAPNVTVTFRLLDIDTTQLPVPVQSPDQPPKLPPMGDAEIVAVSVGRRLTVQVLVHSWLSIQISPLPVPAKVTVSVLIFSKVTVMCASGPGGNRHVSPWSEQPVHEATRDPGAGTAAKTALLGLLGRVAVQVAPQLMPAGVLVTVPVPLPAFCTVTS